MLSNDIVVQVRGIGKRYLVPQKHEEDYSRAPTWRDRLKEFFPRILGAEEQDFFWALKDVSFDVRRGEVLGIVGENGSGKSTLLKILSGVTPPTEGTADLRGRVGSLLEVGTGFHPDLTGRENIFFSGSLLGLRSAEIRTRLHEIIEFSGIGEFIDVPVKRYSSGMYVRLAYSVAALLRSEILILDEVLAVGDEQFRTKTQDHIRQTTSAGKTILFVSHNPKSVAQICDRGIVLEHGRIVFAGTAREVIAEYQSRQYVTVEQHEEKPQDRDAQEAAHAKENDGPESTGSAGDGQEARHFQPRSRVNIAKAGRLRQQGLREPTGVLKWISIHTLDGEYCARFKTFDGVKVRIGFAGIADPSRTYFSVLIHNSDQDRMVTAHSTHVGHHLSIDGSVVVECIIPSLLIGDGIYSVMIDTGVYDFDTNRMVTQDCVPRATYIYVSADGQFPGVGLDEYRGFAHLSQWTVAEQNADREASESGQEDPAPVSDAAE
jgi:lipopolysaccharide transport system ATP-binding protein